jgi:hypothetical protein
VLIKHVAYGQWRLRQASNGGQRRSGSHHARCYRDPSEEAE